MMHRHRIAITLLLALAALATRAAERDIMDMAHEYRQANTARGAQIEDQGLDAAERALRNFLPRPWTVPKIRALFEAAMAKAETYRNATGTDAARLTDEWQALAQQLGAILLVSRDPRAALALGPVIGGQCHLALAFQNVFGNDPAYQAPPMDPWPGGDYDPGFILCPRSMDAMRRWLELNRRELEQRAAVLTAAAPPCVECERGTAAADELHAKLAATAPKIRLTIEGGGTPKFLELEGKTTSSGGTSLGGKQLDGTGPLRTIRIPSSMLGLDDVHVTAVLLSPGYRSVPIDIVNASAEQVTPVTLVPLPEKTLTGTVTFTGDAPPRPFVIRVNVRLTNSDDPSHSLASAATLMQNISEATVDENGRFSVAVPDVARDPILNVPGNCIELWASPNNWVLEPAVVAFDHRAGQELNLVASPRARAAARQPAGPAPTGGPPFMPQFCAGA